MTGTSTTSPSNNTNSRHTKHLLEGQMFGGGERKWKTKVSLMWSFLSKIVGTYSPNSSKLDPNQEVIMLQFVNSTSRGWRQKGTNSILRIIFAKKKTNIIAKIILYWWHYFYSWKLLFFFLTVIVWVTSEIMCAGWFFMDKHEPRAQTLVMFTKGTQRPHHIGLLN